VVLRSVCLEERVVLAVAAAVVAAAVLVALALAPRAPWTHSSRPRHIRQHLPGMRLSCLSLAACGDEGRVG
jgi:hypothetical protein